MSRKRPRVRSRGPAVARTARPAPSAATSAPGATRLLDLARGLADLARREPADALGECLLRALGEAYAAEGPLARDLRRAATVAADSPRALDLGWAREQVRLALAEALGRLGPAADADLRAWLVLAVCETLAREPGGASADRLRPALELIAKAPARAGASCRTRFDSDTADARVNRR